MNDRIEMIKTEIKKAVVGKDEVIEKVLMAIVAGGHILLEDIPGVGKTTLALAFSKALSLGYKRLQFTPDMTPSDITGFTMYDDNSKQFVYKEGGCMCNFLLADEINRTSSKTQSALLEVMQESKVTIDGITHQLPKPFVVMATENPLGTVGTQILPEAQLDRFMIQLSMGYPDYDAQVKLLSDRAKVNPLDKIKAVATSNDIIEMGKSVNEVYTDKKIYQYVTSITEETRRNEYIKLGISPRGALALCQMARASAFFEDRDFVTVGDVQKVIIDVFHHRILLSPKAVLEDVDKRAVVGSVLEKVGEPEVDETR